jgi:hypothetical protein
MTWNARKVRGWRDEEFISVMDGEREVCCLPSSGEVDSHLIAAAPEMLEMLQMFAEAMPNAVKMVNNQGVAFPAALALANEKARAAIAKAKGEKT